MFNFFYNNLEDADMVISSKDIIYTDIYAFKEYILDIYYDKPDQEDELLDFIS